MFGFRQKEDVTAATPKVLKALEHAYQAERGRVPLSLRRESSRASTTRSAPSSFSSRAPRRVWTVIWVEAWSRIPGHRSRRGRKA